MIAVLGLLGVLTRTWALTLVMMILILAFAMLRVHPVDFRLVMMTYLGLPFAWGALICLYGDRLPARGGRVWVILGAGIALSFLLYRTELFLVPFSATLAYAVLIAGFTPCRALGGYRRLGDYSYGMYIYAFPIQQIMAHEGMRTPLSNIAAALPVTLLLAVLSWHLVEEPALRLRAWLGGRRPAQAQSRAPIAVPVPAR